MDKPFPRLSHGRRVSRRSGSSLVGFVDVHHHQIPPFYLAENRDAISASWGGTLSPPWFGWTPQAAIDAMDRNGIEIGVLSLSSPGVWFGDAGKARRLARRVNEFAADLRREYPGRFGFFAAVPLPDEEGSLREIEYALDVLHADGVGVLTSYDGKWLGDASFRAVFDELNRRRAAVFVHPTVPHCCRALIPDVRAVVTEIPQDTSRALANLLFTGALFRHRDIRFIFSHAGGAMPITYGRLLQFAPKDLADKAPDGIDFELRRLHYDIAATTYRPAIAALRSLVPSTQILFGTDNPYAPAELTTIGMGHVGFSREELHAVGRDNALALLPGLAKGARAS